MTDPIAVSTIAAQAFRFMEMSPISSFADDTPQAQSAAEQYPVALDMALEAADWSFASVMVALSPVELTPPLIADPDLPHAYGLPGDLVRLRKVGDICTRWRLDRGLIRADHAAPLPIRYTARITNEAILPATFRHAVSLQLAVLLAPIWLQTMSKADRLKNDLDRALSVARHADRNTASLVRYDGRDDPGDWATEAVR